MYLIGWTITIISTALHFRLSLETEKILEIGIGQSLTFSQCLKCR